MTLDRLTQITSVGITSGITLNNATLTGVTTIASLDSVSVGGTITAVDGNFSGNVTAVGATFSGNVSIAGTLTYEDVTNIDSIGIITARDTIDAQGNVTVGAGLSVVGVSTLGNTVVGGATTELVVNGNARITGILTIGTASVTIDGTNNTITASSFVGNVTGNVNSSGVSTISELRVGTGGTIITTTSNRVGIGTTIPISTFHISGPGSPFVIDSSDSNDYKIALRNSGISTSYIGSGSGNLFSVADSSVTAMLQLTTGGQLKVQKQPAWSAYGGASNAFSSGSKVIASSDTNSSAATVNVDGNFSVTTGRFTAPVAGNYFIYAVVNQNYAATGPAIYVRKNGGTVSSSTQYLYGVQFNSASNAHIFNLAENDYVDAIMTAFNAQTTAIYTCGVCGFLIG
jgi:hypothetical protein